MFEMLFWIDHVIFLKRCSYCKCIYVLTPTFLWIWRMLCYFVLFRFGVFFFLNVNRQSTLHILLTSIWDQRPYFEISLIVLEPHAYCAALSNGHLVGNRMNSFGHIAEGKKTRDFMQPWLRRRHRRPKISQLNVPYLIKKWYATAFNNGCNMTTACLFVCKQQQQKKYFAKTTAH